MTPEERIVIVGNGQAGIQLIDSLRKEGYAGPITVVGEEQHFPYQRPPLSKDYMAAGTSPSPLPLRAEKFFTENDVDSRLGVQVTSIDRSGHTVSLSDGTDLGYSKLVLATGAANRELTVPGSDAQASTACGPSPMPKPCRPASTRCAPSSSLGRASSGWSSPPPPASAASRSPCSSTRTGRWPVRSPR
ncbi:ferredoxin reductase [Arthrobacter crystallopoietes BAB-32]|uniref:Ferredoxin reductase n=1 Tax=Arthrobacter crystallopoietes BAB-32 TaxID=1246476 RepID=N1UYX1_9MICC|nr:ferredoxin reductase [Arthrobacter crystallopoietes BAB-32]